MTFEIRTDYDELHLEELQKVLDAEEYQAVLANGNYEVRLWFFDFLKSTLSSKR